MLKWTITTVLLFMLSTGIFASEKDRVAILDIKSENCPNSLSKAVGDLVSTKIFETKIFVIFDSCISPDWDMVFNVTVS